MTYYDSIPIDCISGIEYMAVEQFTIPTVPAPGMVSLFSIKTVKNPFCDWTWKPYPSKSMDWIFKLAIVLTNLKLYAAISIYKFI